MAPKKQRFQNEEQRLEWRRKERERYNELNRMFETLARMLPFRNSPGTLITKQQILTETMRYIQMMQLYLSVPNDDLAAFDARILFPNVFDTNFDNGLIIVSKPRIV